MPLIWCIIALTTLKSLFSCMNWDMTCNHPFGFHDFLTYRTLGLPICKNDWLNNLQEYWKSKFYLLCKKYFLTMQSFKMFVQINLLIGYIITSSTSIRFFSSMNQDVPSNPLFCFHDFVTDWTLGLTILKNNRMNNLQQYLKFKIYLLSIYDQDFKYKHVFPIPQVLTFQKLQILTMIFSKMFVQRFFSFWGKTAHIASKWLFSSMCQNMTWHPRRLFHDFLTYRTLVLSILKNDGHNNLQQYFKYSKFIL